MELTFLVALMRLSAVLVSVPILCMATARAQSPRLDEAEDMMQEARRLDQLAAGEEAMAISAGAARDIAYAAAAQLRLQAAQAPWPSSAERIAAAQTQEARAVLQLGRACVFEQRAQVMRLRALEVRERAALLARGLVPLPLPAIQLPAPPPNTGLLTRLPPIPGPAVVNPWATLQEEGY